MIVDKFWDGQSPHSFSADYAMDLGKTWKLTGSFVGSTSTLNIENETRSTRHDFLKQSAWYLRFSRENNKHKSSLAGTT